MNNITKTAFEWINQQIAVVPCHYKSKRPRIAWEKYQDVLPSNQQIQAWFAGEHTNIAVICGWQGLTVIDFDSFDAYDLWLEWYVNNAPPTTEQPIFDSTLRIVTGRGVHLYLMLDEPVQTSHVPGIVDIKASGYCVTAPSVHPNGRKYRSNDLPVLRVPTLHGIVPDEWIAPEPVKEYSATPLQSIDLSDPIACLDMAQESLIATVKQRIRITDLIGRAVATRDGWKVAHCPFHDDKEPSFWIDTKRQLCGCYRGCNAKPMDVINLYGKLHGLSNQDAIIALAQRM